MRKKDKYQKEFSLNVFPIKNHRVYHTIMNKKGETEDHLLEKPQSEWMRTRHTECYCPLCNEVRAKREMENELTLFGVC